MLRCSVACLVRQFECKASSLGFEAILRTRRRTLEIELMLQLLKLLIMKDATGLNVCIPYSRVFVKQLQVGKGKHCS
ncbi:hypothetical protein NC653_016742 [Populus alba x Populus x berolinensis]|uniref:Uncharacterized protein n=1 Tax=Populus alba x Populus x berolinensis TaxID=444605 RepID=A0AAD6QNN3_9ROSI|nr:hypothetical protein NC653_016742 [Populus alba x Populus x berolinensis]